MRPLRFTTGLPPGSEGPLGSHYSQMRWQGLRAADQRERKGGGIARRQRSDLPGLAKPGHLVGIEVRDARDQQALLRLSRHDRSAAVASGA